MNIPWTVRRSNQSILKEINPECSLEGTKDDFAVQVLEELKRLCEPFTRNSEFDPQDVFDKTYDFYKENYPELSPYKMASEMIARYRFKKKWKEF